MELTITLPDELMPDLAQLADIECRTTEGQAAWLVIQAVRNRQSAAVRTHRSAEVFKALRELHLAQGKPSTREIERRAWEQHGRTISHTGVHEILNGHRAPSWQVLETVVLALDGDTAAFRALWNEANR